jgi:hypothetical protein
MSRYTQTLGTHHWTPEMDSPEVALCGECPDCGVRSVEYHIEFSGGDGERGTIEYECHSCEASWTDFYRLTTREVYSGPEGDFSKPKPDFRDTIWIDGIEQKLYSVEEGLEIMADIHAAQQAVEAL